MIELLLAAVSLTNAPDGVEQAVVDALWRRVHLIAVADARAPAVLPEPEIYFAAEDEPVMTPHFMAFYYLRTRIIRVARSAWQGQSSLPPGLPGMIYVTLGHEMFHYALAEVLPTAEHHCFYTRHRYHEELARWLVVNGWAHAALPLTVTETGCTEGE